MQSRQNSAALAFMRPAALLAFVLVVAPFVLPFIGFNADLLTRVLIWGLFGIGFDLLFGFTGLLSFGHAVFFGTGGFACAYLIVNNVTTNVYLAMVAGVLATVAVALFLGVFALRRSGIYFAMITLAAGEVAFFLDYSPLKPWTGGEDGLPGMVGPVIGFGQSAFHINAGWPLYAFVALLFWLGFLLARRLSRSPVGLILKGIGKNARRAGAVGNDVGRYKLLAFVISAVYAGLAGELLGMIQGFMPPGAFALETSAQIIMVTVIGGVGTLLGPTVGAAVWFWLRDTLQYIPNIGGAWKLILGLIFIALIVGLRRGICGEVLYRMRMRRTRVSGAGPVGAEEPSASAVPRRQQEPPAVMARYRAALQARQVGAREGVPALEARNLTKSFGGIHAVRGVSLSIPAGEFHALIGPNGAGKSTFFSMLSGEQAPTSGEEFLHGRNITGLGVTKICQLGLSKSYQINQLFDGMTVASNLHIAMLASERGPFRMDLLRPIEHIPGLRTAAHEILGAIGLDGRADVHIGDLSYGEKRRLEIGLAVARSPSVLLLDEPFAGLSAPERKEITALLRQLRHGRTVVLIEHDMEIVFELADRISVLSEGQLLAQGSPSEIQQDERVRVAYLGGVKTHEPA